MALSKEQFLLRKKTIENSIEKFKNDGLYFKDITSLAKSLSEIVSEVELASFDANEGIFKKEPRGCSYQTLLVNTNYKELIESYLKNQVVCHDVGEMKFKSIIAVKDLEISNLKNQVKRLENAVAMISKGKLLDSEYEKDHDLTCKDKYVELTMLLIKSFEDYLDVDIKSAKIKNLMEVIDNELINLEKYPELLNKLKNKT